MLSLRVALVTKMTEEDNDFLHLQELEAMDEKQLRAQQRIELYQARISKVFNTMVKERVFQIGDLVLAVKRPMVIPMVITHKTKGKFQSEWEGPFMVETVYSIGAYRLANANGNCS